MKKVLTILFLILGLLANAQTEETKLAAAFIAFHQALVNSNTVSINQQTDKALSYGHSNGWVENKKELILNLATGNMDYEKITEDSISIQINGNMANVRFIADISVTRNAVHGDYHLKVLEVWVKKGRRWILFARQAVK